MNNISLRRIKFDSVVIFILLLSLALRIVGINYGLPHILQGDEQSITYGSLKMLELKTLIPAFHEAEFRPLYYPPVMSYINLIFLLPVITIQYLISSLPDFLSFKDYLIINPFPIWITVRTITAFLGTATVFLVYLIGKEMFNRNIGLYASLLLGFSFLHVQLSHFTRHWIPAVFFTSLFILIAVYIYNEPKRKYYIWLGILAGLAFGVSYITAVGLIVFIVVHFSSKGRTFIDKIKDCNLWISIIIFTLLASIFIALHPQEFTRILFGEDSTLGAPKGVIGLLGAFTYYFRNLWNLEPIMLISSAAGILALAVKYRRELLILLSLPISYVVVIYVFFHSEVRYLVFILPMLAVLAAVGIDHMIKKINGPKMPFAMMISVIFFMPLLTVMRYDVLLLQGDSRIQAMNWIYENVAPGGKIVTDFYFLKLNPTKNSILLQNNIDPSSLRIKEKTLLRVNDAVYPQPAYEVLPLHFVGQKIPGDVVSYVKENEYQYFALSYWDGASIADKSRAIMEISEPIKEFSTGVQSVNDDVNGNYTRSVYDLFSYKLLGPNVIIYRILE